MISNGICLGFAFEYSNFPCQHRKNHLCRSDNRSLVHSQYIRQRKNRNLFPSSCLSPAEEGSRTLKVLLPHGPEPCASANSATSAFLLCRFVYISQRHVELYYKTVILSTTFSKKYFLKKIKKVLAKSFRLWYIITRRWELNNKSSERYAEVSELADEQD